MTAKRREFQTVVEPCETCGRDTSHTVSIEIRKESKNNENAEFSREPYRIMTYQTCGETTSQRMNNA